MICVMAFLRRFVKFILISTLHALDQIIDNWRKNIRNKIQHIYHTFTNTRLYVVLDCDMGDRIMCCYCHQLN